MLIIWPIFLFLCSVKRDIVSQAAIWLRQTTTQIGQWQHNESNTTKIRDRRMFFEMYACSQLLGACGTTWPGLAWQGSSAKALLNFNEKLQRRRDIYNIFYILSSQSHCTSATSKETQNQYSLVLRTYTQGYNCFPCTYQLWTQYWAHRLLYGSSLCPTVNSCQARYFVQTWPKSKQYILIPLIP